MRAHIKRGLVWLSKGLLVHAGLAMAVVVVLGILIATLFPARTGCEECGTHASLVISSALLIAGAVLCVLLAAILALGSTFV